MKSTCIKMMEKSLSAMLSTIEIYNKPDFKYREETFIVLAVNAWELLFKAKMLKDNKNNVRSLYVYNDKNKIKRTRCGNPMTIELTGAMKKLAIDPVVAENITSLVEIRDTAIHYFHSKALKYVVFTLGVAMLRNYHKLLSDWFGKSLVDFNFFIMPLAFLYDFKTLHSIEVDKSPPVVANIVRSVAEAQDMSPTSGDFHFACEITAELVSAKKSSGESDLTVKIDQSSKDAQIAITTVKSKLDQYPYSYRQLVEKVKVAKPDVKPAAIDRVIREQNIKNDPQYADYSFRTKSQSDEYKKTKVIPKGTATIYNDNAFRCIINHL